RPLSLSCRPDTTLFRSALNVGDCRYWDGKPIPSGGKGGRSMFHGAHTLEHLQELAARGAKTPDGSDAAKTLHRWNTRHERLAKKIGRARVCTPVTIRTR